MVGTEDYEMRENLFEFLVTPLHSLEIVVKSIGKLNTVRYLNTR